jgi:hypothetical protein
MAKKETEEATEVKSEPTKAWDTTLKLGAIEEANYAILGATVVKVDKASGEVTLRSVAPKQPCARAQEVPE